jgi:hypothetical protein
MSLGKVAGPAAELGSVRTRCLPRIRQQTWQIAASQSPPRMLECATSVPARERCGRLHHRSDARRRRWASASPDPDGHPDAADHRIAPIGLLQDDRRLSRAPHGGLAHRPPACPCRAAPLPGQRTELAGAAGLVLAEDLVSLVAQPPFDTSAMDGYAVAGGGPWTVRGEVRAGHEWPERLQNGDAVGISTWAPVPRGTNSVIPVEVVVRHDLLITTSTGRAPAAGLHIRRSGENAPRGAVLAPAGTRISPAMLGLCAAAGHDTVVARPRPSVRLIVTGDELLTAAQAGAVGCGT